MCHLQSGLLESTLDIKALVDLGTIQYRLVAANLLGDVVESFDELDAELLPLLVLRDGDILDVADES